VRVLYRILQNKRAAGEGFSWAAGLIVIALIVILAVFFSIAGKFGQKSVVINYDSNVYSSELQRVAAYSVVSDFNSTHKGKILSEIYSNAGVFNEYSPAPVSGVPVIIGKRLGGVPVLPIKGYNVIEKTSSILYFASVIYLSCKECETKYFPFGLERSKDGK